jgi:hypothetical protein
LTTPQETFPDRPPEHGIEIVRGADGVDLVDTWAPDRPSVHFTHAEYEAFLAGVLVGEFDFPDPPVADRIPRPRMDTAEPDG